MGATSNASAQWSSTLQVGTSRNDAEDRPSWSHQEPPSPPNKSSLTPATPTSKTIPFPILHTNADTEDSLTKEVGALAEHLRETGTMQT